MSHPVLELAKFVIKPEYDVDEVGSAGYKMVSDSFDAILRQPGARRAYWSKQVDQPEVLRAFFEWDSIEDHYRFQKSEDYQLMLDTFRPLVAAPPIIKHMHNPSHSVSPILDIDPTSGTSPYPSTSTEYLHLYFSQHPGPEEKAIIETRLRAFVDGALTPLAHQGFGFKGYRFAWSVEGDVPFEGSAAEKAKEAGEEDAKGAVLVVFAAWESIEKWREMQGSELMQAKMKELMVEPGLPGLKGANLVFVRCQVRDSKN